MNTTPSFDAALDTLVMAGAVAPEKGRWVTGTGCLHAGWYQGRGAFGGLVGAWLDRGMASAVDDSARWLQTITMHFAGPLIEGPFSLRAKVQRASGRVSHAVAEIVQGDGIVAFGSAVYTRERPVLFGFNEVIAPKMPAPTALQRVVFGHGFGPRFAAQYDYRFGGDAPKLISGADRARLLAWVRPLGPERSLNTSELLGVLDALPPAAFARVTRLVPAATTSMTASFAGPLPRAGATTAEPMLLLSESDFTALGYSHETSTVWDGNGQFMARAQQTVAILRDPDLSCRSAPVASVNLEESQR